MAHDDLKIRDRKVSPHKCIVSPDFNADTILVNDQFEYVALWLKRNASNKASVYWDQARNFYSASLALPKESSSLTQYYCMLNATKALLESNGLPISELHGVCGKTLDSKASLSNEICELKGAGIIVGLFKYFNVTFAPKTQVNLKDIFYNLQFIHRAFVVTYPSTQPLFIPIEDPHFVKIRNGDEAYFCATIKDPRYAKESIFKTQRGWERDRGESNFVIRRKKRFKWITRRGTYKADRISALIKYHHLIRREIKYIYSPSRLWYYKRNDRRSGILHWPTPLLIIIAMHRLSELTRYHPETLIRHFACQHNWLLTEFLRLATDNFIDQIASEITSQEIMVPGIRK